MANSLVKIVFELEESDLHDHGTESLWAEQICEEEFVIDNIPFYIYGLSYRDVVLAEVVDDEWRFVEVIKNGGHSTYRIFVNEGLEHDRFREYLDALEKIGCTKEDGGDGIYSVDVPPTTDIYKVYHLLEHGENDEIWAFEEGKCGHVLKSV